jgi:hypothetical protein
LSGAHKAVEALGSTCLQAEGVLGTDFTPGLQGL